MYSRNTDYWHLFAVISDTFVIKFKEYDINTRVEPGSSPFILVFIAVVRFTHRCITDKMLTSLFLTLILK